MSRIRATTRCSPLETAGDEMAAERGPAMDRMSDPLEAFWKTSPNPPSPLGGRRRGFRYYGVVPSYWPISKARGHAPRQIGRPTKSVGAPKSGWKWPRIYPSFQAPNEKTRCRIALSVGLDSVTPLPGRVTDLTGPTAIMKTQKCLPLYTKQYQRIAAF